MRNTIKDFEAGQRVKSIRKTMKMSQSNLGDILGITYQQIQKYESGANGMNVTRLHQIACALGCTVSDIIPNENEPVNMIELMEELTRLRKFEERVMEAVK